MALEHPKASSSRQTLDQEEGEGEQQGDVSVEVKSSDDQTTTLTPRDNEHDQSTTPIPHPLARTVPASFISTRSESRSSIGSSSGSIKGKEKALHQDPHLEAGQAPAEIVIEQVPSSEGGSDDKTAGSETSTSPSSRLEDVNHRPNPWQGALPHGESSPTRPPLATLVRSDEHGNTLSGSTHSSMPMKSSSNTLTFSLASSTRPILRAGQPPATGSDPSANDLELTSTGARETTSTGDGGAGRRSRIETGSASGSASGISAWATQSWKLRSGKATMDQKRLKALGFEEELARDFDFWASAGLTVCNIGGFPGTVLAVLTAMETGGSSMYAFAWPISGLFMMSLAAVLGEMASTWPVAGAMFTWTFRLCRSSKRLDPWARYFSWIVGSLLLCSHILLQIIITWQFAHNLLGTIALYTRSFHSAWTTVAICWAVLIGSGLVVSSPIVRSPWFWRGCGLMTIMFFLTLNITLLTQAKSIKSFKWVFTNYENATGFSNKSYVYMLGWVLTCIASGMESAAHIAEDTRTPSRTVPLSMFWSVAATYAMGWISICVLLATLDSAGLDPGLRPSIALIANSIPRGHTTLVLIFVLISFAVQSVAQLLATSRFTWALARESALPCSNFLRRLSPSSRLPILAIWIVVLVASPAMLFLLVDQAILSTILLEGAAFTLMLSYAIPVLIYLFLPRDTLSGDGRVQFTLRKFSKPAAVAGSVFSLVFMIMLCLPTGYPVTAGTASYSAGIIFVLVFIASLAWIFYGNAHYAGPIKTTTRWTIGAEVELPRSATNHKTSTADAALPPRLGMNGGRTDSEIHGRTARVFTSLPTQITERTEDRAMGETTIGTEWSTDWDGEDEDDDEEDGESQIETRGTGDMRESHEQAARWRSNRSANERGALTPDEQV